MPTANDIPIRPSAPSGGGGGTPPPASNPNPGSGSGTGKTSSNPYLAAQQRAQAKADREAAKAKRKAAQKYLTQANTLGQQAAALRIALGANGFKNALDIRLRGLTRTTQDQDSILLKGFRARVEGLQNAADDNDRAASDQTFANAGNRARERSNALSEATAQGAGESDMLRAQGASLNNWNANQSEVNRAYHDTLTGINTNRVDLNQDTLTGRANIYGQANSDRAGYWTDYYNQRSETLTQLSNIQGMRAEAYANAYEMVGSKSTKRKQKGATAASRKNMRQASLTQGMAWENPGIPDSIQNWKGAEEIESNLNSGRIPGAPAETVVAKPSGASLRSWT